jgi:hypothetical protein
MKNSEKFSPSAFHVHPSKMISHFPTNKPIPSANPLEQPSICAVVEKTIVVLGNLFVLGENDSEAKMLNECHGSQSETYKSNEADNYRNITENKQIDLRNKVLLEIQEFKKG